MMAEVAIMQNTTCPGAVLVANVLILLGLENSLNLARRLLSHIGTINCHGV
jgi:hypothetical protein